MIKLLKDVFHCEKRKRKKMQGAVYQRKIARMVEQMTDEAFFAIYLPALKEAFEKDDGIQIPDPERYIKDKDLSVAISVCTDQIENEFVNTT